MACHKDWLMSSVTLGIHLKRLAGMQAFDGVVQIVAITYNADCRLLLLSVQCFTHIAHEKDITAIRE